MDKEQWHTMMVAKYGSEEAVTVKMKEWRAKAGKGGFAKMSKEKVKEISRKGVNARKNHKQMAENPKVLDKEASA